MGAGCFVLMTGEQISFERFVKSYLKDFDWKVQLLIGSDKISSMRETHLVLNLLLHTQDNTTKEITVESLNDPAQPSNTQRPAPFTKNHQQNHK